MLQLFDVIDLTGVMILVHGDDRGLVLPPRVAEIQAIVVPCGITASSTPEERKNLMDSCKQLVDNLVEGGIRAEGDYRDNYSPGWKFNHWELKVTVFTAKLISLYYFFSLHLNLILHYQICKIKQIVRSHVLQP